MMRCSGRELASLLAAKRKRIEKKTSTTARFIMPSSKGFFSLGKDAQAFMVVWFSSAILAVFVAAFLDSTKRFQRGVPVLDALSPIALGILVSIGWILFGAVGTTLMKNCSKQDSAFIIEFVRRVFENIGDQKRRPG